MASTIRTISVHARELFLLSVVLLLMGMGGAPKDPQISIAGPYANLSGMFLGAGSVFMQINNAGGRDALLSASVDLSGAVAELHDVKGSRMIKVEKVVIPSRGTLTLKPGGMHIMLFNMPKTVKEGSEISVKLLFERSGERTIAVRFDKPNGTPGGH